MNMGLNVDSVFMLKEPYFHLVKGYREYVNKLIDSTINYQKNGHLNSFVTVIKGEDCMDEKDAYSSMQTAYSFPDYFGHNWDALDECINDLSWINKKSYITYITNSELILKKENIRTKSIFFRIMKDAVKEWTEGWTYNPWFPTPPTPFHVVFQFSTGTAEEFEQRIREYGITEFNYLEIKD